MKWQEGYIFEEMRKPVKTARKTYRGGSKNPIVFHDYESFVAKFKDNPKTTDDCYTPQDVWEAVAKYVGTITDLDGKEILRPFYPGGDYVNAEYPEDGVVIDNPPFSMFTKICKFYTENEIPFFLFGPGMSILSICKYCTAVIVSSQVEFSNGAKVRLNFATNLLGDTMVTTAVQLDKVLRDLPSQNIKKELPVYRYPDELLSASDFQIIAKGHEDFAIKRGEAVLVNNLDCHPHRKNGLFGAHMLVTKEAARKAEVLKNAAREAAAREAAAREAAARKDKAKNAIVIELSYREQKLVDSLQ